MAPAVLGGARGTLREAVAAPLPPRYHREYARITVLARGRLGEDAFAAAWGQGRALSLDAAVAPALREAIDLPSFA